MAFCGNCGSALQEGQRFCPACGKPVGGGATQSAGAPPGAPQPQAFAPQPQTQPPQPQPPAPPQAGYSVPPPGYQQAPPYGQGYSQPVWGAQPQKRSRKGLWIGLASAVVVIAVACVLVFVVFWSDISGGGAASTPEGSVRAMLTAFENQDVDALYDLLDPDALEQITSFMNEDDFKSTLEGAFLEYDSIKFSGIRMTTDNTGDESATVTITGGSVSLTQDGDTTTEDVTDSDEPVTFDLVKRGGSWYIDPYSVGML